MLPGGPRTISAPAGFFCSHYPGTASFHLSTIAALSGSALLIDAHNLLTDVPHWFPSPSLFPAVRNLYSLIACRSVFLFVRFADVMMLHDSEVHHRSSALFQRDDQNGSTYVDRRRSSEMCRAMNCREVETSGRSARTRLSRHRW